MYNKNPTNGTNEISNYYREAFETMRDTATTPEIFVEFYPYVNTNHTIRFRNQKIFVRISDSFEGAPPGVHKALAYILIGKLLGKRIPAEFNAGYKNYVSSAEFSELALRIKRLRGKKHVSSPAGEKFDLAEVFRKLNFEYFESDLEMPALSWSKRHTYRRLGHYDTAHNTIIISRSLDAPGVPEYVIEYIVYHEMLHMIHPVVVKKGRRKIHTKSFRRDEELFRFSREAEDWIERNARALRKHAKRNNR